MPKQDRYCLNTLRARLRHGGRRRQFAPIRYVPLAGAGRYFGRSGNGADRCAASCAAFVAHRMTLAQSGSTEEVLTAFFYGREDIIPEMFSRIQKTLPGASNDNDPLRHFIYYIDRHIELDGDSHGPMGWELLEGLVADSPQRDERALRAACNSIKARIELWNGTLSTLRDKRAA